MGRLGPATAVQTAFLAGPRVCARTAEEAHACDNRRTNSALRLPFVRRFIAGFGVMIQMAVLSGDRTSLDQRTARIFASTPCRKPMPQAKRMLWQQRRQRRSYWPEITLCAGLTSGCPASMPADSKIGIIT
jgi:hypothetical protein